MSLHPRDGAWQLDLEAGSGQLVRTSDEVTVDLDVAGFAMLYCGAASPATLAQAGLISGPRSEAAALDLLSPASPAQLLDYF